MDIAKTVHIAHLFIKKIFLIIKKTKHEAAYDYYRHQVIIYDRIIKCIVKLICY
jgi:hypothetical protein